MQDAGVFSVQSLKSWPRGPSPALVSSVPHTVQILCKTSAVVQSAGVFCDQAPKVCSAQAAVKALVEVTLKTSLEPFLAVMVTVKS